MKFRIDKKYGIDLNQEIIKSSYSVIFPFKEFMSLLSDQLDS